MTTLSAYSPYSGPHVHDTAWWVALASSLGLDRVWFGQQSSVSLLGGVGYAAGRGHRVQLGSAVTLMPTTTPFTSALDLRSLAQLSDSTVAAYFSPGYPAIQHALGGRAWTSPLTATRQFFAGLRGLLAGGDIHEPGDYYSTTFDSPADDISDRVELGLGVLRPAMARLAGEIADGAVTWLSSPEYLRAVLVPALDAGADVAARPRPRVVATLHAGIGVSASDSVEVVRRGVGPHLSAPHYRDMLRRDGLDLTGPPTDRDIADVIDRRLFVLGGPEAVLDRAAELVDAGADEVSIVLHQPGGATRDDIRSTWTELAAHVHRFEEGKAA
ncbi:MAG: LLM class flavin-dependent oxidoreductase [Rhodococcus sp. (in: high G+C Gram-positive bacteria)]